MSSEQRQEPEEESQTLYAAFPLQVTNRNPATVRKCEKIFKAFLGHPNFFTGFIRACEDRCGSCEACITCKTAVAQTLTAPKTLAWEVWSTDDDLQPIDFVGILRLSRIEFGCDALAHYFFFDHRLKDKTDLLLRWGEWIFSDHEPSERLPDGWKGLKRLTVEIPSYAFALARHASKRLGFGGRYEYEMDGRTISVEGLKENVKMKDGEWFDLIIMGIQRESIVDAS